MKTQIIVLKVTYDDSNTRDPLDWDWGDVINEDAAVLAAGPPQEVPEEEEPTPADLPELTDIATAPLHAQLGQIDVIKEAMRRQGWGG